MSDKMSFNSASTVLVFNINTPGTTGKASGAPVVQPAVQEETTTEDGVIKLNEPTKKQSRIGELVSRTSGDSLATLAPPPDAESFKAEEVPEPKGPLPQPPCMTELPAPLNMAGKADPLALQVGWDGEIPRWKPGSVINFATYATGFPKPEDSQYAANHLLTAANVWNGKNIGVTFKMVKKLEDACFVLGYGGPRGNILATAFFPNGNDLNNVLVYQGAFSAEWKPHMWSVLVHELGHILGLRHEFAVKEEKNNKAVVFGPVDNSSAMNYTGQPPKLTDQDVKGTKQFYELTSGSWIGGMQVKDWVPDN